MNLSPDQYFQFLYERALDQQPSECFHSQRQKVKEGLIEALGDFSELHDFTPSLSWNSVEKVEEEEYVRELVHIQTAPHLKAPVYILTPKSHEESFPAVLAIPGHGQGHKEAAGLVNGGSDFAVQLVKKGLKVFVPELLGVGSRLLGQDVKEGREKSCDAMSTSLIMVGKTLAGLRYMEMVTLLDRIQLCRDVKANHIGIFGFSGGAFIAAITAALDARIKAVTLCGFMNTFQGSILSMPHCLDNYLPGILKTAELPNMIGLIAPRPLFVESGKNDPIFPFATAKEGLSDVEQVYRQLKSEQNLAYVFHEGGHEIDGSSCFEWLKDQLIKDKIKT
ncbi:dienelactone hydrolase [Jeotgalibacillus sp. S-D1]|uniref:dienelactone hydrolase family protein n=1 Tax=Jeotgalibacillus sp. S-D1 TaxID=2552189 RepID=UPI00105990CC|nr:alpha/beta hydrolase family protein [Jeotgalibacillus sp. S-D1]TDL34270.1 dienelactone hydrolase [Jeotgalibacillus sp. S-D1]